MGFRAIKKEETLIMANRDFQIPIKGYSASLPPDKQAPLTTGHMDNIYPFGALDNKIRLVQRPGMDNVFAQQIAGSSMPVVVMLSVTTVD